MLIYNFFRGVVIQLLSHTAVMNRCAQNLHDSMAHPHLLAQLGKTSLRLCLGIHEPSNHPKEEAEYYGSIWYTLSGNGIYLLRIRIPTSPASSKLLHLTPCVLLDLPAIETNKLLIISYQIQILPQAHLQLSSSFGVDANTSSENYFLIKFESNLF